MKLFNWKLAFIHIKDAEESRVLQKYELSWLESLGNRFGSKFIDS